MLRADPELLRSIVNQAADAVCLHEVGGRILDVNRRMCETLGYSREELLALSVMDIDVTATREETAKAASMLVPGEPVWAERVLRRKDGSTFPIELSLSRVVFGERQLMLGIARDITDRKRAEAAQAEAQRVLEERVQERTRHLEAVNRRLEEEMPGARALRGGAARERGALPVAGRARPPDRLGSGRQDVALHVRRTAGVRRARAPGRRVVPARISGSITSTRRTAIGSSRRASPREPSTTTSSSSTA